MNNKKKTFVMCASITVESTLITLCVLACVVLLIIMNGYLHDQVVLNGICVEILYSDQKNIEKVCQEEIQDRILWLTDVKFAKNENSFRKTISWNSKYTLPVDDLLAIVLSENSLKMAGKVQKQGWSMSQIIRYVNQN